MPDRPPPRFPEPNTEPYWEAAKHHRLTYQRCNDCDYVVFYPKNICGRCSSLDLAWHTSKGEGTLYTYTLSRQIRSARFTLPLILAYVDLDEGFRILTNIVGIDDPERDLRCGMRVQVEFEAQETGEYPTPVFRPVRAQGSLSNRAG